MGSAESIEQCLFFIMEKKFQEAKNVLLLLKEKIPAEHPKYPQCQQMLEQIKKELKQ